MTNLFKLLTIALFAAITLNSCSKDDKDENSNTTTSTENKIVVGSTTYKLQTQGLLEDYGTDDGNNPDFEYNGTNFDLYLMTEGVTPIYDPDGALDSAYGSGLIFYFESFSTDPDKLTDGEYKYETTAPFPVGSFDLGFYGNPSLTLGAEITGGTYKVVSAGSIYNIEFNLTDQTGKKITGTFKGKLNIADLK